MGTAMVLSFFLYLSSISFFLVILMSVDSFFFRSFDAQLRQEHRKRRTTLRLSYTSLSAVVAKQSHFTLGVKDAVKTWAGWEDVTVVHVFGELFGGFVSFSCVCVRVCASVCVCVCECVCVVI